MLCRHCLRNPVNRPRGLCWHCYYTPGVLALYPTESKFGKRDPTNRRPAGPAPSPTPALPGSPEKVAVLESRVALMLEPWHPKDGRVTD